MDLPRPLAEVSSIDGESIGGKLQRATCGVFLIPQNHQSGVRLLYVFPVIRYAAGVAPAPLQ